MICYSIILHHNLAVYRSTPPGKEGTPVSPRSPGSAGFRGRPRGGGRRRLQVFKSLSLSLDIYIYICIYTYTHIYIHIYIYIAYCSLSIIHSLYKVLLSMGVLHPALVLELGSLRPVDDLGDTGVCETNIKLPG